MRPFLDRWVRWIQDGQFGAEQATGVLYAILNEIPWERQPSYTPVFDAVSDFVLGNLKRWKDNSVETQKIIIAHLECMIDRRYFKSAEFAEFLTYRLHINTDYHPSHRRLFELIGQALQKVGELHQIYGRNNVSSPELVLALLINRGRPAPVTKTIFDSIAEISEEMDEETSRLGLSA